MDPLEDINNIPLEMVYEIFLKADRRSLQNLCRVNRLTMHICNDEYFWKEKMLHDYGTSERLPGMGYKESWIAFNDGRLRIGIAGFAYPSIYRDPFYEIGDDLMEKLEEVIKDVLHQYSDNLIDNVRVRFIKIEKDPNGSVYLRYRLIDHTGDIIDIGKEPHEYLSESLNELFYDSYEDSHFYLYKENDDFFDELPVNTEMFYVPHFTTD